MTGRLSARTLGQVPAGVGRPDYDFAALRVGMVHLGLGAFHRAQQAVEQSIAEPVILRKQPVGLIVKNDRDLTARQKTKNGSAVAETKPRGAARMARE